MGWDLGPLALEQRSAWGNVSHSLLPTLTEHLPSATRSKGDPMAATGILYPEQLSVLREVLESHCNAANIKPGTPEYESKGARVIALYENGARTLHQLFAGLNEPKCR